MGGGKGFGGGGRPIDFRVRTFPSPPPTFPEGSHLDLGDGLGGGDLDGVEGLGTDKELHGGEGGELWGRG